MEDNRPGPAFVILSVIVTGLSGVGAIATFKSSYGLAGLLYSVCAISVLFCIYSVWMPRRHFQNAFFIVSRPKYKWSLRYGVFIIPLSLFLAATWAAYRGYSLFTPEYDRDYVDLAAVEVAYAKYVSKPAATTDNERATDRLDVWKKWIAHGVPPSDTQQLLVLESVPFKSDYQTLFIRMHTVSYAKAIDGAAFLVSNDGRLSHRVYRQVPFIGATDNTAALIMVSNPKKGESLMLLIQVVAKGNGVVLPANTINYEFRLVTEQ